jgi:hypothetical protein
VRSRILPLRSFARHRDIRMRFKIPPQPQGDVVFVN